ncbi:hypothetical protein HZY97_17565 [Sphingomonas sp. R-74633]|uniref:STM3941 family protein n=1 Tax=Sphingomonas sp. R-74633 TaxID=2751188 RepID=UPI0015D36EA3|nr:hypothetical protein [Sphingomonas sp. R-74633]
MSAAARLVAYTSRGKQLGLIALGLLMSGAAAFAVRLADPVHDPLHYWAGWGGLILFPLCTLGFVRQLFRTGPVMEIGPEGVLWRRWSHERIPWTAFTRAADMSIKRQRFVSLWLREPERYRPGTLFGRLASGNKLLGFGEIALSAQGLTCTHEEMLATVQANAPGLFRAG